MVWVVEIEVDDSVEIAEGWIGTSFGVASKADLDFFASLTNVAWSNSIFLFFPVMLSSSITIEATGGGNEVARSADPWAGAGEGGGVPRSEGRGEAGIGSGDLKEEPSSGGVEGGDSSMAHAIGVRGNELGVGVWSRVGGKLGVCEAGSLTVKAIEDR